MLDLKNYKVIPIYKGLYLYFDDIIKMNRKNIIDDQVIYWNCFHFECRLSNSSFFLSEILLRISLNK